MSTYAKARRAAFLSLFLLMAMVAAVGPASAERVAPPRTGPAAPPPPVHHTVDLVATGPSVSFWLLIGLVVVLAVTVLGLAAGWRYDRAHRAVLSSQMARSH